MMRLKKSLRLCLLPFVQKWPLLMKLEANPRQLREPDTKPLGNGLFEIRTMGADIARGIWVYQSGERIFLLRIFIKKSPKTPPAEIDQALRRLEEMQNEI